MDTTLVDDIDVAALNVVHVQSNIKKNYLAKHCVASKDIISPREWPILHKL